MLFENNYYEFDDRSKLANLHQGYLRGNMFNDEYKPYKNYKYLNLNPSNQKENLLYKIMELEFGINDLNLYLDLHPNDKEKYNVFKDYIKELLTLKKEYVEKFGPLEICDNTKEFEWLKEVPWERKTTYV